jgi:hypothetical protein
MRSSGEHYLYGAMDCLLKKNSRCKLRCLALRRYCTVRLRAVFETLLTPNQSCQLQWTSGGQLTYHRPASVWSGLNLYSVCLPKTSHFGFGLQTEYKPKCVFWYCTCVCGALCTKNTSAVPEHVLLLMLREGGVEGQRLSYRPHSPRPMPKSPLPQANAKKGNVELREGGVEGQRLSYRPHSPLPQRIARKAEPREGGVESQRLSYRPPCPLPQACPIPNAKKVELREGGVEGQRPR